MDTPYKWDEFLTRLLQEENSYANFFEYIYNFLRRRTDFFHHPVKAEETIKLAAERSQKKEKFFQAQRELLEEQLKKKEEEKKKREAEREIKRKKRQEEKKKKAEEEAKKAEEEAKKKAAELVIETKEKVDAEEAEKNKDEKSKPPPPPGNGGILEKYTWTQTLQDVDVSIWLPENFNKKELTVDMTADGVFVQLNDQEPILDGKWPDQIDIDESLWTLEDGDDGKKFLHLSLTKWKTKDNWWRHVCTGEKAINTDKICPEPSKLGELDPYLKGQVSKQIFNIRQKEKGLPTTEDMEKKKKFEKIMRENPGLNLDFAKTKFRGPPNN